MQTLQVISVNIWQILISLLNLLLLFLVLKKFLYKPVRKMLTQRQDAVEASYKTAEEVALRAQSDAQAWNARMQEAEAESSELIRTASVRAGERRDQILADAKMQADGIIRQAQQEADLERRRAKEEMKQEIVAVATLLTEKLLDREINETDHRKMMNSFIDEIGDYHEGNE